MRGGDICHIRTALADGQSLARRYVVKRRLGRMDIRLWSGQIL